MRKSVKKVYFDLGYSLGPEWYGSTTNWLVVLKWAILGWRNNVKVSVRKERG